MKSLKTEDEENAKEQWEREALSRGETRRITTGIMAILMIPAIIGLIVVLISH